MAVQERLTPWRPISELPEDAQVLAVTQDRRLMLWNAQILRGALRPDGPSHLQFPASHFIEIDRLLMLLPVPEVKD